MERKIEPNISQNFTAAKFFSILIVVFGHYPKPFDTWVIVTIGLLIFGYSSGFFTYLKYNKDFDKKKFLWSKIERLGLNLMVINIFLLILFLIKGEPGIWTWHSLINALGLNGFLTWLRIPNQSPFGAAMWFFTLLLIFYMIYPLLEYLNRSKIVSYIFTILFILTAFYLHHHIQYGHMLWLTCCGFIAGIFCARNSIKIPLRLNIAMFIGVVSLMFAFNYFLKIKYYNFFFIFFSAMSVIFFFDHFVFPQVLMKGVSYFSDSVLEIYLIHSYLFVKLTPYQSLNFIISLAVILAAARILQKISSILLKKIKA
jgi:hypothetical protein